MRAFAVTLWLSFALAACSDDAPAPPDAGLDAPTAVNPHNPPTNCPIGHCPDARP